MKKSLFSLIGIAALVFVASCNKEQEIETIEEGNIEETFSYENLPANIPATISATLADTKNTYDEDGKYSWEVGDQVCLYYVNNLETPTSQGWLAYEILNSSYLTNNDRMATFTLKEGQDSKVSALATYACTDIAVYGNGASKTVARPYTYNVEACSDFGAPFITLQQSLTGDDSEIILLGSKEDDVFLFQTAAAVLKVTVTGIPEQATELRLCTTDQETFPLDGDFILHLDGTLEIAHDDYRKYYGGAYNSSHTYVSVNVSAISGNHDFYFNIPTGAYAANTLSIVLLDASGNVLTEKSIKKTLTYNRNDLVKSPSIANEWITIGTGKYADYYLQGKCGVIEDLWDVTVQKSTSGRKYRIVNPYSKGVNMTQTGDYDSYLEFEIKDDATIEFTDHLTGVGVVLNETTYDVQLHYNSSTTTTKVFAGTKDAPEIIQFAPVYRDETETFKESRHKRNYMIRMVMPDYVSKYISNVTKTGDSGNGNFSYTTTSDSSIKTIFFISDKSYPKFIYDKGDSDINPVSGDFSGIFWSNKTDNNNISYAGSKMVSDGKFTTGPLYLCWLTYGTSYSDNYMLGSKKFYFLSPTDQEILLGNYTNSAPSMAGGSAPDNTNFTIVLSDKPAEGNMMISQFDGMTCTTKVPGIYDSSNSTVKWDNYKTYFDTQKRFLRSSEVYYKLGFVFQPSASPVTFYADWSFGYKTGTSDDGGWLYYYYAGETHKYAKQ